MAIVRGHFCLPVLNMSAQAINSELTFWGQWANFLRKRALKSQFSRNKVFLLWCAHSWNINLRFSWKQAEMAEIKYRTGITVCVFTRGRSKWYQPSALSKTTSLMSWVLHFKHWQLFSVMWLQYSVISLKLVESSVCVEDTWEKCFEIQGWKFQNMSVCK